ncbi:hypothetical protein [Nocardioides sp.]|uniref:hypothetical protein n=1 Tax=Nocardioides sp. TaxID=35761 RepID=UPI002B26B0C1|nr:hypothetical protein [Nocardioides sp.]
MITPPAHVLDLFAVPEVVTHLPGGSGSTYRAGDLVLSPGRDETVQAWLSPVLARLAVRLDEDPGRRARDLRVAMPVPARDGSWVVNGWAACRYEPEAVTCLDLDVTLAAGRSLHAHLAVAVGSRPPRLHEREDRWARAERVAFGPTQEMVAAAAGTPAADVVDRVAPHLSDVPLGTEQLVHADLAGNVLLDRQGAPLVIDVSPAWRPVQWAEAVAVVDLVTWFGAPLSVVEPRQSGPERQALLRALIFRALSDEQLDPEAYAPLLSVIAST